MRPVTRLPKTIGEYANALRKSRDTGAQYALRIIFYVLVDKYGWNTEQLLELRDRIETQALAISDGYMTPKDITTVLREEYLIEV